MSSLTKIRGRDAWGAQKPRPTSPQASPTEAFIHITETPLAPRVYTTAERDEVVRGIQRFHMVSRGWSDVGYHFLVWPARGVQRAVPYAGRDRRAVPAAQLGHNTGTLAIAIIGASADRPDPDTVAVVLELLERYPSLHWLGGHRDVVATDCPGDRWYAALGGLSRRSGLARVRPHDLG